jgi:dTDP-4-dehydrorhamnose reductase
MKILITEASNLVAESIIRVLQRESEHSIHVLSEKAKEKFVFGKLNLYPADLMNFRQVKDIAYSIKPDVIINTFEFGTIYENDKKKMQDCNVLSADNIFSISRVLDSHLISISNEFVFNGKRGPFTEKDSPDSISYFGNTKHAMENSCLINVKKCTVVRHSLLYGYNSFNYTAFVSGLVSALQNKKIYNLKENYMTNPCLADEFAYAVLKIIDKKRTGIYHIGGKDYITIHEFADKVAELYSLDSSLIKSYTPEPKKRFGLVNLKAETELGMKFSGVDSGLIAMKHYIYGEKILPI